MTWDDAVKAHAAWKMRLLAYIRDPSKKLDPAAVRGAVREERKDRKSVV